MSAKQNLKKVMKKTVRKTLKKAVKSTPKKIQRPAAKPTIKPAAKPLAKRAIKKAIKKAPQKAGNKDLISDNHNISLTDLDSKLRVIIELVSDIKKTQRDHIIKATEGMEVMMASGSKSFSIDSDNNTNIGTSGFRDIGIDSTSGAEGVSSLKEKAYILSHIRNLQLKLKEANSTISVLNEEVDKRNSELRRISESYNHLKESQDDNHEDTDQLKHELKAKDEMSVNIINDVERYKRQLKNSNRHIENLYAKLVESEKVARQTLEENKLMRKQLQENDIAIDNIRSEAAKRSNEAAKKISLEKQQVAIDAERKLSQQTHFNRILQKKVSELNAIIATQQRDLSIKDRKLAVINETYRKMDQIISRSPEPTRGDPQDNSVPTPDQPYSTGGFNSSSPAGSDMSAADLFKTESQQQSRIRSASPQDSQNRQSQPQAFPTLPYTADEIVHIVRTAHEHGDSEDQIRHSLISSGYDPVEVDKAIKQVI